MMDRRELCWRERGSGSIPLGRWWGGFGTRSDELHLCMCMGYHWERGLNGGVTLGVLWSSIYT